MTSPAPEAEGERVVAVAAGVELGAVLEPAGVVDLDDLPGLRLLPLADLEVDVAQAGGGDDLLAGSLRLPGVGMGVSSAPPAVPWAAGARQRRAQAAAGGLVDSWRLVLRGMVASPER